MNQRWKEIRLVAACLLVVGAGVALRVRYGLVNDAQAAETAPASATPVAKPGNEADEKAIRATADEFVTQTVNARSASTCTRY